MKIWKKFCILSRHKQIACVVLAAHLILILSLCIDHLVFSKSYKKKPIAVRTVTQLSTHNSAPSKALKTSSKPPTKSTSGLQKITAPASKPLAQKTSSKKKAETNTNIDQKKAKNLITKKEKDLLEEISANLDLFSNSPEPQKTPFKITLPSSIPQTQNVKENQSPDPTYEETLAAYLQNSLDLPEIGEVVAKLEIDAQGMLKNCKIIQAKSKKNEEFLKKRLPELVFPCLNDSGNTNETLSLTITFKNVENIR